MATNAETLFSLLTGWSQQGAKSLFATQQALVNVVMRQTMSAMRTVQEGLSDPAYCPAAIVTDLFTEATKSFLNAQRILLTLAQQENDLVMGGVKERVGSVPAAAMLEMTRRSLDTFLEMQQEFLNIVSGQAEKWQESVRTGTYNSASLKDVVRQSIVTFARTQQKLLTVIAEETDKATSGKEKPKGTKTEVAQLAREAVAAFLQAQKKLVDVVDQQMNVNVDVAKRSMGLMSSARVIPFAELTREGVRNFVEAEKKILDSMVKPRETAGSDAKPHAPKTTRVSRAKAAPKRPKRAKKVVLAQPALAGA